MRFLILDPFHGAAGDMITAALLDCGADRDIVVKAMTAVVGEPAISRVTRAGIQALKIDTKALPVHRGDRRLRYHRCHCPHDRVAVRPAVQQGARDHVAGRTVERIEDKDPHYQYL